MAEGTPPRSALKNNLANEVLSVALDISKPRGKTLETARQHLETLGDQGDQVKVGLLGDSLIERMSTTGQWRSLQPWPSEAMFSNANFHTLNAAADENAAPVARIHGVASFGCGGDKIEHVLYRFVGDDNLRGLRQEVHPKLWIIHAGTNNLTKKKGLSKAGLEAMEALLKALYHLTKGGSGTRFLLTGLFYRENIPKELVDQANLGLRDLVSKLQHDFPDVPQSTEQSYDGQGKHPTSHKKSNSDVTRSQDLRARPHTFEFLEPPADMPWAQACFDDQVHLNQEGYRRWMEKLVPKVEQMLRFSLPRPYTKKRPSQVATSAAGNDYSPLSPTSPVNKGPSSPG